MMLGSDRNDGIIMMEQEAALDSSSASFSSQVLVPRLQQFGEDGAFIQEADDDRKLHLQDLTSDLPKRILEYCDTADQISIMATSTTLHAYVVDLWSHTRSFVMRRDINAIDPLKVLFAMANLLEICVAKCDIVNSHPNGGDLILQALSLHCTLLQRIDISSTSSVTNNGCAYLARRCHCLEYVDISFCSGTDYGAVLILRGVHPDFLTGALPGPIGGDEISSVALMVDSDEDLTIGNDGEDEASSPERRPSSSFSSPFSGMSLSSSPLLLPQEDDIEAISTIPLLTLGTTEASASETAAASAEQFVFNPKNIVVRRQPSLLDGRYFCPWQVTEVHTYYPDGSFSFSREIESKGWLVDLEDRGDNIFADRLRYINVNLPPWIRPEDFQPGVMLKNVAPHEFLVIQSLTELDPPAEFPRDDAQGTIAALTAGQSTQFVTENDEPLLVSRMRMTPLEAHEIIPPLDLFSQISEYYIRVVLRGESAHQPDEGGPILFVDQPPVVAP